MRSNVLYRFFNANGRLLYIGITIDPISRIRDHREKHWWEQVARIELARYPDRQQLHDAERVAIEREGPLYNIAHNSAMRERQRIDRFLRETVVGAPANPESVGQTVGLSDQGVRLYGNFVRHNSVHCLMHPEI